MIHGRCPWVKCQYYHALVIDDLYESESLSERNYKIFIWDKNKDQMIGEIGSPYKSSKLINLSETRSIKNITELKIIGTHHNIDEQVASINQGKLTSGILLKIDKEDLFTFEEYDFFDCTSEILSEI